MENKKVIESVVKANREQHTFRSEETKTINSDVDNKDKTQNVVENKKSNTDHLFGINEAKKHNTDHLFPVENKEDKKLTEKSVEDTKVVNEQMEIAAMSETFELQFSDLPEFMQSAVIKSAKGADVSEEAFKFRTITDDKGNMIASIWLVSNPDNMIKVNFKDPNEVKRIDDFINELSIELESIDLEDYDDFEDDEFNFEDDEDVLNSQYNDIDYLDDYGESKDDISELIFKKKKKKIVDPKRSRAAKKAARSPARKKAFLKAMAKFRKSAAGKRFAKARGKYLALKASLETPVKDYNSVVDSLLNSDTITVDEAIKASASPMTDLEMVTAMIPQVEENESKQKILINTFKEAHKNENYSGKDFMLDLIETKMIMKSKTYKECLNESIPKQITNDMKQDFNKLSKDSKDVINDLLKQKFNFKDIKDAMEDGSYLDKEDIDQDTAEEIHNFCQKYL